MPTATIHVLTVPNWLPSSINKSVGRHWAVKARLKKADREMLGNYAIAQEVLRATGKRRVSLRFEVEKRRGRMPDGDNFIKGLLDNLVSCHLLIDDSPRWLEMGTVEVVRGTERRTVITLEDI